MLKKQIIGSNSIDFNSLKLKKKPLVDIKNIFVKLFGTGLIIYLKYQVKYNVISLFDIYVFL
jgi:hypothetical protein